MSRRDVEYLIQQVIDGTIAAADFARLQAELRRSEKHHATYREYIFLHAALEQQAEDLALPLPAPKPPRRLPLTRRQLWAIPTAAAALLILALVLTSLIGNRTAPSQSAQVRFETSPDSTYSIHQEGDQSGEEIPPPGVLPLGRTLELTQGTMEITFPTGVRGIISAPATMTPRSHSLLQLAQGQGWFHVPEGAEGFQIRTSGLLAKDLGTEFGVISFPGSTDEIHVLDGEVEVSPLHNASEKLTLSKGESRRLHESGHLGSAPGIATPFQKSLPGKLPYLHFSFDKRQGETLLADGNHPFLQSMQAEMIQSDGRPAETRFVPGPFGRAISFDGLGDGIKTNWPGVYGTNPLTITVWAKLSGPDNYGGLVGWGVGKWRTRDPHQWKVLITPREPWRGLTKQRIFRCSWGRKNQAGAAFPTPNEEWSHLAVVYTGHSDPSTNPELRFYLNGERLPNLEPNLPTPPQRPSDLLQTTNPLCFGYSLSDNIKEEHRFFGGAIDEVFIIEGALTEAQIIELYESNTYSPLQR